MTRIKKEKVWIVQGLYFGQWEDLTYCLERQDGKDRLKDYRINDPKTPTRLIMRLEPIAPIAPIAPKA